MMIRCSASVPLFVDCHADFENTKPRLEHANRLRSLKRANQPAHGCSIEVFLLLAVRERVSLKARPRRQSSLPPQILGPPSPLLPERIYLEWPTGDGDVPAQ